MIYFIIFYVVSIIVYYFLARGTEEFDNSKSAFLMFICMFIPIINTVIFTAYLLDKIDWVAFVNKFFKLK